MLYICKGLIADLLLFWRKLFLAIPLVMARLSAIEALYIGRIKAGGSFVVPLLFSLLGIKQDPLLRSSGFLLCVFALSQVVLMLHKVIRPGHSLAESFKSTSMSAAG
jgi:hypothetical protein